MQYIKKNQLKKFAHLAILTSALYSSFSLAELPQKESNITEAKKVYTLSSQLQQKLHEDMVWVEGGSFQMGTNEKSAQNRSKPQHKVTLDGFYIGKTEVTQELYHAIMNWNVSYFQCANCPVNNISWKNIQLFIERLNQATGKTFRLPTEAEWAYAAKGGIHSKGYKYSGSNNIDDVAWHAGNSERRSHPVAQKQPNELGLYDMTGNMWEFCHDDMSRKAYTAEPRVNPVYISTDNLQQTSLKVLRGSGYEFDDKESLIYVRDGATSNVRMPDIGFRLAMSKSK